MKNIILSLITLVVGLTSCGYTQQEEIVIEHVRGTLKNPDSFELDSIKFRDTITQYRVQMIDMGWKMEDFERESEKLDFMMSTEYLYSLDEKRTQLDLVKTMGNKLKVEMENIKKLKGSDKDTVVGYTYDLYFKGTNSFGAVEKDHTTVMIDMKNRVFKPMGQLL